MGDINSLNLLVSSVILLTSKLIAFSLPFETKLSLKSRKSLPVTLSFKTPVRCFLFSLAFIAISSVISFKCFSIAHLPQISSAHVLQNNSKLNILCAPQTASDSTPDFIEVLTVRFRFGQVP